MPRLRHYDDLNTARFVTFGTFRGEKTLLDPLALAVLLQEIEAARIKYNFRLLGYVIMPEHVHLVLHPVAGTKLGLLIREIKSKSARRYFKEKGMSEIGRKNIFWQRRCYDHNCRTASNVREKIIYCHKNPVRRGLSTNPVIGGGRATAGIRGVAMCH